MSCVNGVAKDDDKKKKVENKIILRSRLSTLRGWELIQQACAWQTSPFTYLSKLQVLHRGLVF